MASRMSSLNAEAVELLGCDTARTIVTSTKRFLVVGYNRHSRGEWRCNGQPYSFDYVEEHAVASGRTWTELRASMLEYKRLAGLTVEEYLIEEVGKKL